MLYVFPDLYAKPGIAGFHIPKLLETYRSKWGNSYTYINSEQLLDLSRAKDSQDGRHLLVNWLDLLYESALDRRLAIAISFLPTPIIDIIVEKLYKRLASIFNELKNRNLKIIFYFHDLKTFSRIPVYKSLDQKFRYYIYKNSDFVLFAENSAYLSVKTIYGSCNKYGVSQLGSYREFHGPLHDKASCRKKLGIETNMTTILAIGTLRKNRNIDPFVENISLHDDLFLLTGGRGHKSVNSHNVSSIKGYVSNDQLLLMIGAADYILHSGKDYLTSATVRLSISYHLPVIAECYGATTDMCGGAIVDLGNFGSDINRLLANLPRHGSAQYTSLKNKAFCSDIERSWDKAADSLYHAVTSLARGG